MPIEGNSMYLVAITCPTRLRTPAGRPDRTRPAQTPLERRAMTGMRPSASGGDGRFRRVAVDEPGALGRSPLGTLDTVGALTDCPPSRWCSCSQRSYFCDAHPGVRRGAVRIRRARSVSLTSNWAGLPECAWARRILVARRVSARHLEPPRALGTSPRPPRTRVSGSRAGSRSIRPPAPR